MVELTGVIHKQLSRLWYLEKKNAKPRRVTKILCTSGKKTDCSFHTGRVKVEVLRTRDIKRKEHRKSPVLLGVDSRKFQKGEMERHVVTVP